MVELGVISWSSSIIILLAIKITKYFSDKSTQLKKAREIATKVSDDGLPNVHGESVSKRASQYNKEFYKQKYFWRVTRPKFILKIYINCRAFLK